MAVYPIIFYDELLHVSYNTQSVPESYVSDESKNPQLIMCLILKPSTVDRTELGAQEWRDDLFL